MAEIELLQKTQKKQAEFEAEQRTKKNTRREEELRQNRKVKAAVVTRSMKFIASVTDFSVEHDSASEEGGKKLKGQLNPEENMDRMVSVVEAESTSHVCQRKLQRLYTSFLSWQRCAENSQMGLMQMNIDTRGEGYGKENEGFHDNDEEGTPRFEAIHQED